MEYILIAIITTSNAQGIDRTSFAQEFKTLESCQDAKSELSAYHKQDGKGQFWGTCVLK